MQPKPMWVLLCSGDIAAVHLPHLFSSRLGGPPGHQCILHDLIILCKYFIWTFKLPDLIKKILHVEPLTLERRGFNHVVSLRPNC